MFPEYLTSITEHPLVYMTKTFSVETLKRIIIIKKETQTKNCLSLDDNVHLKKQLIKFPQGFLCSKNKSDKMKTITINWWKLYCYKNENQHIA